MLKAVRKHGHVRVKFERKVGGGKWSRGACVPFGVSFFHGCVWRLKGGWGSPLNAEGRRLKPWMCELHSTFFCEHLWMLPRCKRLISFYNNSLAKVYVFASSHMPQRLVSCQQVPLNMFIKLKDRKCYLHLHRCCNTVSKFNEIFP